MATYLKRLNFSWKYPGYITRSTVQYVSKNFAQFGVAEALPAGN